MEVILDLDSKLLLFFNSFHTAFLDYFFWFVSDKATWLPFYLVLLLCIVMCQKKKSWLTILGVVLLIVLCDKISTDIFKYSFQRLRPTHDPVLKDLVNVFNNYRGGKFGFVSSHAANSFGLATFMSLLFKRRNFTVMVFIWAVVVSFSRMYFGVHFPGDILCGGLLGALIAWGVYNLYCLAYKKVFDDKLTELNVIKKNISGGFSSNMVAYASVVIGLSFLAFVMCAKALV